MLIDLYKMKRLWLSLALFFSVSASAGLLKPHFPLTQTEADKGLVVIFYANETDADGKYLENIQNLQSWLSSYKDAYASSYKKWLQQDLVEFSKAAYKQISDIKNAIDSQSPQSQNIKLVVFTNQLAKQQSYVIHSRHETVRKSFITQSTNFFTKSSPLSQLSSFELALKKVQEQFDAKSYNFALITKSHGDSDHVIRPKTMINTQVSKQTLFERFYQKQIAPNSYAVSEPKEDILKLGDKKESSEMYSIEKALYSKKNLSSMTVSKDDYVQAVAQFSKKSPVKLLFMDACETYLSEKQLKALQSGAVHNVYTSDVDGLDYEHINYQKAFSGKKALSGTKSPSRSFLQSIINEL